jgi:hypothetical protein
VEVEAGLGAVVVVGFGVVVVGFGVVVVEGLGAGWRPVRRQRPLRVQPPRPPLLGRRVLEGLGVGGFLGRHLGGERCLLRRALGGGGLGRLTGQAVLTGTLDLDRGGPGGREGSDPLLLLGLDASGLGRGGVRAVCRGPAGGRGSTGGLRLLPSRLLGDPVGLGLEVRGRRGIGQRLLAQVTDDRQGGRAIGHLLRPALVEVDTQAGHRALLLVDLRGGSSDFAVGAVALLGGGARRGGGLVGRLLTLGEQALRRVGSSACGAASFWRATRRSAAAAYSDSIWATDPAAAATALFAWSTCCCEGMTGSACALRLRVRLAAERTAAAASARGARARRPPAGCGRVGTAFTKGGPLSQGSK